MLVIMARVFIVGMTMEVTFIFMGVHMDMHSTYHQPPYNGHTQYNQKYSYSEFHRQGQLSRDSQFEH